jgi:hypothetical protein
MHIFVNQKSINHEKNDCFAGGDDGNGRGPGRRYDAFPEVLIYPS